MTFKTNEQIQVLAEFKNGNLKPRKFRWQGRLYRVKQICGAYRHREGEHMTHNYSVMAQNGCVYEITFKYKDTNWYLRKVHE